MTEMVTIEGIQEVQDANLRRIAALQPTGAVGKAIKYGTIRLHRYAVAITHVWKHLGGGLRASHRMAISGLDGKISIDPSAMNPRGQRPADYGPREHARGGTHAFYQRAVDEEGPETVRRMGVMIIKGIK